MNYLLFICSDGKATPEKTAVMQRETPGWVAEMDGRGLRLLGRALEPPATAATVRVRDGETLVTDGPFMETKAFMAGFDVLECADLDEAMEVAAKHPVSWFHTIEIRPFVNRARLGEDASAFGRGDDSAGSPYLLATWTDVTPGQGDLQPRGPRVVGGSLQGPETGHDGPSPRRGDAARRRAVHRESRVHRRHRRRHVRGPAAGDRARGRASECP